jgi:hypothetical protein|tara:strand:+ start:2911 stop:3198 length:288 start_codon:yes stop_codon:yes gene_type:complete
MKKLFLIFIFSFISNYIFSQFIDHFSNGDFTNNPLWNRDVGVFGVDTNYKLHLNDSATGFSSLVTQSQAIVNDEIEVFSESSNVEQFKYIVVLSR